MPELPEVETIIRDLGPALVGAKIRRPQVHRPHILRNCSRSRFLSAVGNRRIDAFRRRAKNIIFELDDGNRVMIQLRMTGSLFVREGRLRKKDREYLVFQAGVGEGRTLLFRDIRRLGTLTLMNAEEWAAFEARIGPEPLDQHFRFRDLAHCLAGTRQAIKKAIMDQRKLAGVGNIYANEALFLARIDPSRPAGDLTDAEYRALHRTIRRVLQRGIDSRGTTLRDYRTGTGEMGEFQYKLKVYGRGGQPCSRCRTTLVTTHDIDGRSTTLCWRCQT